MEGTGDCDNGVTPVTRETDGSSAEATRPASPQVVLVIRHSIYTWCRPGSCEGDPVLRVWLDTGMVLVLGVGCLRRKVRDDSWFVCYIQRFYALGVERVPTAA
jgi:hypothetical protein